MTIDISKQPLKPTAKDVRGSRKSFGLPGREPSKAFLAALGAVEKMKPTGKH